MSSSRRKNRDTIDAILKWAKTGLIWGQNVNSVVPIPAYGPISQALIALINQIAAARTNEAAAAAVLSDIQTLAGVIGRSRDELDSYVARLSAADLEAVQSGFKHEPSFQDPFDEFLKDLRQLEALSNGLKHKCSLLSFVFSSKDAEIIKEIQEGVLKATNFFEMRCLAETKVYLQTIGDRLAVIHATVKNTERVVDTQSDHQVLESLPHADASYRASTNVAKSRFLEGTQSRLFGELEEWIHEDSFSHNSVCILSGGAGTGKSTVASELARRLDEEGKLGASFFFARGITDLDSTRLFFPTIAYQLANKTNSTLRQAIIDAAREHSTQGRSQAMKYEALALLHAPFEKADKDSPIFVIVDALDECTQEASKLVPEMLELLMAATHHGPLRIFLTSRPDQLVECKLQSSRWLNIIHTISIDPSSDDASRDVAKVVEARLHEIAHGPELLYRRPDILDSLAGRAQGLFIYAQTAVDFLETYPGTLDEGVDLLLSEDSEDIALGPLDQLYLTVLSNAFPRAHLQHLPLRARVQSVLACIALLRNPMTPRVLESLTSLTRNPITCQDADSVLDRLRSVVVFERDAPDEVFRPMHATFPQFLVDEARCTNELFLVHPRRQHARLADACMRVLLSLEKAACDSGPDNGTALLVGTEAQSGEDIPDWKEWTRTLLPDPIPEHMLYACRYWAAHLCQACTPGEHRGEDCFCGDLVELLRRLVGVTDNLTRLVMVHSMSMLKGWTDGFSADSEVTLESILDLDDVYAWLPSDGEYDALRAQLRDSVNTTPWRMVLQSHAISVAMKIKSAFSLFFGRRRPRASHESLRGSCPSMPLPDPGPIP